MDLETKLYSHVSCRGCYREIIETKASYMIYNLQATAVENAGETGVSCGTSTVHRGTAAQYVVGEI